ncbi:acyltransferase family protein [Olleya aquimaris]|uniref:Peptidoglycan/LPS O-acetylase OafA/YrhL n=1 Tax=Olleya aquimaris TaxID=639310 RepID=A0A327RJD7_9FLAO|nr:acyltransferase [Olleya aquimaris]RAJ16338.1 peptidoglycan/LPS O-acetylase OafA/YrhL [Olleya aquimaris]
MLTKTDTLLLKGLGILAIVFHNFMHRIPPVYLENEFYFDATIFSNYLSRFTTHPEHIFQYLFSYFGHYGVQLFIFLSGYGLMIAYKNKLNSFWQFISTRLIKLYPAFLLAVLCIVVLKHMVLNAPFNTDAALNIVYNITFTANWIPNAWYTLSGPFWFYSMIFQMYIIFYWLVKYCKITTKMLWVVLLLSYVVIFTFGVYFEQLKLSVYLNFIGNLPVFVLGMILAKIKFDFNKISKLVWVLALVIFILGQYNRYFWYVSQIAFVTLFLITYNILKPYCNTKTLKNALLFTGKLSMYLFVVNGFMRTPWLYLLKNNNSEWFPYLLLVFHIVSVFIAALLLRAIEQFLMSKLIPKTD